MLWPQELGLSGSRFNSAIVRYKARQDHFNKETLALLIIKLDIPKFIYFGIQEGDSLQKETSHRHRRSLGRQRLTGDR